MKVPFVHGPNDLRLDDVPTPIAGAGDVVIRPAVVGICGSDLGYLAAGGVAGPSDRPIPLGHELSGTVETVGEDVSGFSAGDRVIVNPFINFIGNGGPEGGFARQLLIRDVARNTASLMKMPAGMSFEQGALVEPLAVALHALDRSQAKPDDHIALFGAGPIGLAILAVMQHRHFEDVVVFDPSPLRRNRALGLGARIAVDPLEQSPIDVLSTHHGTASVYGASLPATGVFIDAAGAPGVADNIIGMARIGASFTMVAVPKGGGAVPYGALLGRELTVRGSLGYPGGFHDALDLLAQGLNISSIVSHRFNSERVVEAFAAAARADEAIKVLVNYAD